MVAAHEKKPNLRYLWVASTRKHIKLIALCRALCSHGWIQQYWIKNLTPGSTMRRSRKPQPIFMLVLGCIALGVGGSPDHFPMEPDIKYPEKPGNVTIDQITAWLRSPSPARWMTLSGGQWACEGIRVYYLSHMHDTDAVCQDQGPVVVQATFNGDHNCADLQKKPATGVLLTIRGQRQITANQKNAYLGSLTDSR